MAGLILLVQPSLVFVWDVVVGRLTAPTDILGVTVALAAIYLGMTGER